MTGSRVAVNGASLPKLLISQRFGMSARETENGFMPEENCFVAATAMKYSAVKRQ
jgi:hypothetical protein